MEQKYSRRDFLKFPALLINQNAQERTQFPTPSSGSSDNDETNPIRIPLPERVKIVEQQVSVHDQELVWQGDNINQINYVLYELATYVLDRLPPSTLPPKIETFLANHREKLDQDIGTS